MTRLSMLLIFAAAAPASHAAVTIEYPLRHQVVQRGTPVAISLKGHEGPRRRVEWRVVALRDAFGKGTDWAALPSKGAKIPAGGWYRLEVRAGADSAAVEPFGVGEVFLIAGQSYADNCSDEIMKVMDPQKRVTVFDLKKNAWRIADDPQPTPSRYRAGSIWPRLATHWPSGCAYPSASPTSLSPRPPRRPGCRGRRRGTMAAWWRPARAWAVFGPCSGNRASPT